MPAEQAKRENMLVNLGCNLLIPILILSKLSSDEWLGAQNALLLAIAFPLGYGIYDWSQRRTINLISILGLLNVLITGIVGLLELAGIWIVVKETSIPLLIGVFVLISMKTEKPLVKQFIYNDQVIDVPKIEAELEARDKKAEFEKLFEKCSYIMAFSFLVSAILNFVVAKLIVTAPGGTQEFNEQIAKMTGLSYIVIAIPTSIISFFAMYQLFKGIKALTGIGFMDAVQGAEEGKPK
ncbi:MAG: MFS transporter [Symploca sp. SIO2D2]|nr:MFS transporter [Symploca sp. SIO2D2]